MTAYSVISFTITQLLFFTIMVLLAEVSMKSMASTVNNALDTRFDNKGNKSTASFKQLKNKHLH